MIRGELVKRVQEQNEKDRSEATLLLVLGVPLFFFSLAVMIGMIWFLLMWITPGEWIWHINVWIGMGITLLIFLIDTARHPTEDTRIREYYLVDGTAAPPGADGADAMISVTDPQTVGAYGRNVTSALSNLILAGPRYLKRAFGLRATATARGNPGHLESAMSFLGWLEEVEIATEEEVNSRLRERPDELVGSVLATELLLVSQRHAEGRRIFSLSKSVQRPA